MWIIGARINCIPLNPCCIKHPHYKLHSPPVDRSRSARSSRALRRNSAPVTRPVRCSTNPSVAPTRCRPRSRSWGPSWRQPSAPASRPRESAMKPRSACPSWARSTRAWTLPRGSWRPTSRPCRWVARPMGCQLRGSVFDSTGLVLHTLTLFLSFGRDNGSRWCFLPVVYAGEVKVTCCGIQTTWVTTEAISW